MKKKFALTFQTDLPVIGIIWRNCAILRNAISVIDQISAFSIWYLDTCVYRYQIYVNNHIVKFNAREKFVRATIARCPCISHVSFIFVVKTLSEFFTKLQILVLPDWHLDNLCSIDLKCWLYIQNNLFLDTALSFLHIACLNFYGNFRAFFFNIFLKTNHFLQKSI